MTNFKRFSAAVAATLMAACMVAPMAMTNVSADETYSITINNTADNHTYEAYQIFSGDLVDGVLSNIVWGSGITDTGKTALGNAAEKAKALTNEAAVIAFAEEVAPYLSEICVTDNYEDDSAYVIGVDTPGYYLVKDADESLNGADDAYTRYIVEVLGTKTDISPKSSTPSVIKKVEENVKAVTATGQTFAGVTDYNVGAKYNDVADYSIGDAVSFKLYGTLPSTLGDYDSYYYLFTDTLADSFTAPAASAVNVYIDGTKVEQGNNLRVDVTEQVIKISFEDIKAAGASAGSIVTVEYDAVLNENAVIGLPGQENKVDLTYSNNPNESYNPTITDGTSDTPDDTGKTPEDKVIVFTYQVQATKVDGTDNNIKLAGAEFILLNSDKTKGASVVNGKFAGWVDIASASKLTTPDTGIVSVAGLDDGTYYLRETDAPDKYNLLEEDFKVVVSATTVNNQVWSGTAADAFTGDLADGTFDVTVENNVGSTLPGTGGIGTTLFYLGGGAMVAVAGVYLISKKRMNNADTE